MHMIYIYMYISYVSILSNFVAYKMLRDTREKIYTYVILAFTRKLPRISVF